MTAPSETEDGPAAIEGGCEFHVGSPSSPSDVLLETVFLASTTAAVRRRILGHSGLAIVISVPGRSWVGPFSDYLKHQTNACVIVGDGQAKKAASQQSEMVASTLAEGRSVIGISHLPGGLLPSPLLAGADITVQLSSPSSKSLRRVLRKCSGKRVPVDIDNDVGAVLDFHDLVSAIRPAATPRETINRLHAIARARRRGTMALPRLDEATFYGQAREWGLALARDIAAVRQGLEWSQVDRGCIFFGAPGTGKSWLARMIAAECGLPLIEASVADLFATSAGYLDSVIKAQREVFARAAALSPCILFWDELDAMPNRATISPRGRDWWLPVIEDFLLQLSSTPPGVILLGATNRIQDIDTAILRPGRMERAIEVRPPATADDLAGLLRFHLGNELSDANLTPIAQLGIGATAADVMEWIRCARRLARGFGRAITIDDLRSVVAPKCSLPASMAWRVAVHEAGHAVVSTLLQVAVSHVTISGRSCSTGHIRLSTSYDIPLLDREYLEKRTAISLAGRAAEVVFFGSASACSAGVINSDLFQASRFLAIIHASLGKSNSLLCRAEIDHASELLQSDRILQAVVEHDLQRLHGYSERLVRDHRSSVEVVAQELLQRQSLLGEEIVDLVKKNSTVIGCDLNGPQ